MSHFKTTEISEVALGQEGLQFMTVNSPALQGRADITLYIPPQAQGLKELPVVTLLHGVYCSHWAWALKGRAHISLQEMIQTEELPPMILAMPSDGLWSDGSGYVPHHSANFEKWIVEDVPQAVHECSGNALEAPHFISGLSMGGYGAMRLGAEFPDRYQAFTGHSSSTTLLRLMELIDQPLADKLPEPPEYYDVFDTLLRHRDQIGPFRFDCGVDDFLIGLNRELHAKLNEAGIAHTYEEFPGAHEWPYWVKHVRKTFAFFAAQLV